MICEKHLPSCRNIIVAPKEMLFNNIIIQDNFCQPIKTPKLKFMTYLIRWYDENDRFEWIISIYGRQKLNAGKSKAGWNLLSFLGSTLKNCVLIFVPEVFLKRQPPFLFYFWFIWVFLLVKIVPCVLFGVLVISPMFLLGFVTSMWVEVTMEREIIRVNT